jgi:tetrahydromethanopterin S-methyltransferase subunit A
MVRRLMRTLGRALPADGRGENARAVRIFARVVAVQDLVRRGVWRRAVARARGERVWPVTWGAYAVGDPAAPVAICTLTSTELIEPLARVPGVAIAGRLYTVNLGIEKIILNVTANPAIRFLVLCGKESPVFHPGQGLRALCRDGVDAEGRIVGAAGHLPLLRGVPQARIDRFRRQVELIDCTGETDLAVLREQAHALAARVPRPFTAGPHARAARSPAPLPSLGEGEEAPRFAPIRPGGRRQPLAYDPKGFFVITLDEDRGEIIVRHYLPDATPAHKMRGRAAEAMVLGLIREDLISQLSHAGYLGAELAKAEAALRFGAHYEQDRPLRPGRDGAPRGPS